MTPDFQLLANGADITANVRDRLLSLTFHDEAELKSDLLTLALDDRPTLEGAQVALPDIGTVLELFLGYGGHLVPMGKFKVDKLARKGPPNTLTVEARAADMSSPFRSRATKSWHDTTLGEITRQVAADAGLEAKVDANLDGVPVPAEHQTAESPMAFLNRVAKRHDAVAKPANGFLVLAPRGTAKAVTGQTLPGYTLRLVDCAEWSWEHKAREEAGEAKGRRKADGSTSEGGAVAGSYWDVDNAKRVYVQEGQGPAEQTPFPAADKREAKAQVAARKNQKDRANQSFSFTRTGDPRLMAEQKLELSGFRPGIPTTWRVKSVEHRLDGQGYTSSAEAELFQAVRADPT
ncbi:MAG: phage late control D family protein [Pseudomonadota bacterium]